MDIGESLEITFTGNETSPLRQGRVIGCSIPTGRGSLRLTVCADARPVGLGDLVPLARAISDGVTGACVRSARQAGLRVPCGEGCSTCCHFLSAVSVPEALRLWDEMRSLADADRRPLLAGCLNASKKILTAPPPPVDAPESSDNLRRVSRWYASLNLACPFLSDHRCVMYANRPIACREYVAICPQGKCGSDALAKPLPLPVRMSECLHELACRLTNTESPALFLPLAPLWAKDSAEHFQAARPADELIEQLLSIIETQAKQSQNAIDKISRLAG